MLADSKAGTSSFQKRLTSGRYSASRASVEPIRRTRDLPGLSGAHAVVMLSVMRGVGTLKEANERKLMNDLSAEMQRTQGSCRHNLRNKFEPISKIARNGPHNRLEEKKIT